MPEYVALEELENACRQYGISYGCILDAVKPISAEDVVSNMPISKIQDALAKQGQIFATQIWTKNDIVTCIKDEGVAEPDEELVMAIAAETVQSLEDCSDNWNPLQAATKRVLDRRNKK